MDDAETSLENNKKNSPLGLIVVGLLAAVLLVYLVTRPDSVISPTATEQPGLPSATSSTMVGEEIVVMEDVKTFALETGSFYYQPNTITVTEGDTVRIILNSVDTMHDFAIDELGVRTEIVQSGDTGEVTFVADTVGEFEFYCSVGEHRAQGMVGTLIVEEATDTLE